MAVKMISREWCATLNDYRHSYVLDSAADVSSLPKCGVGSTAIVVEKDGPIYMVGADGEWEEL